MLDLRHFSETNRRRRESPQGGNHSLDSWSLSDWLASVNSELGAAATVIREQLVIDGLPLSQAEAMVTTQRQLNRDLREALANTLIQLDLLAQAAGIDLTSAVMETFDEQSEDLGYPVRLRPGADLS